MNDPDVLIRGFERNTWIIRAQVDGLSHEDTLIQTPYNVNCLNWVVGHIVDSRGRLLRDLGAEPAIPLERTARYRRESEPVLGDGPGVIRIEELISAIEAGRIDEARALTQKGADVNARDEAATVQGCAAPKGSSRTARWTGTGLCAPSCGGVCAPGERM